MLASTTGSHGLVKVPHDHAGIHYRLLEQPGGAEIAGHQREDGKNSQEKNPHGYHHFQQCESGIATIYAPSR